MSARHGMPLLALAAWAGLAQYGLAITADSFEDDNAPTSATAFAVMNFGNTQSHNLHTTNDQDWAKFYWVTSEDFNISVVQKGTNIDAIIEIWQESFDGSLKKVLTENSSGLGLSTSENLTLDSNDDPPLGNGYYYLRVYDARSSPPGINKTGSAPDKSGQTTTAEDGDTDYEMDISVSGGFAFIVAAVDVLNSGFSPSNTIAVIDGVTTQAFVGGAVTTIFTPPPAGVHTIVVTTASGYFSDQDPTLPGEVANPQSVLYGNPREFTMVGNWQIVVFVYVALVRVEGKVIDEGNGNAGLQNVSLSFEAQNGVIETNVFDRYPQGATYSVPWQTDSGGDFPTNVWLPLADYDITLEHATLGTQSVSMVISGATGGMVTNIGTFTYDSGGGTDSDTDGLLDSWETNWFGNLNQIGTGDPDEDGLSNELEETRNSDPTRRIAPAWWTTRDVYNTSRPTNDFAAINQGQLKWLAQKAADELDAQFSGGAGTDVSNLVNSFSLSNNYQAVNLGQLKCTAATFYDRLIVFTNATFYPWTDASMTNDNAAANMGQAKHLFSFDVQP